MTRCPLKQFRKDLTGITGRVQHAGDRVVVDRNGKPAFAVVPVEDLEALQRLEDAIDLEDARKALKAPGRSIRLAEVRKRLGL